MFDRYIIGKEPSSTNIRVEEHRAPTDESLRLLKEMQAKAERSILDSFRLDSNAFKCVVHYKTCDISNDRTYLVQYLINSVKREVRIYASMHMTRQEIIEKLVTALATDIAVAILTDTFKGLP